MKRLHLVRQENGLYNCPHCNGGIIKAIADFNVDHILRDGLLPFRELVNVTRWRLINEETNEELRDEGLNALINVREYHLKPKARFKGLNYYKEIPLKKNKPLDNPS